MKTIFERCVVCGQRPEPARRLAVALPEERLGVVCGHHDPTASGFRDDLFFGLFRWHGLAIGDAHSVATAETVATVVVAALTADRLAVLPRPRPDRSPWIPYPKAAAAPVPAAGQPGLRRHSRFRRASCGQA